MPSVASDRRIVAMSCEHALAPHRRLPVRLGELVRRVDVNVLGHVDRGA